MATLSERITTLRHSGYQTSEIAAILDVTPAEVHIHDVDPASPDPVESSGGPTSGYAILARFSQEPDIEVAAGTGAYVSATRFFGVQADGYFGDGNPGTSDYFEFVAAAGGDPGHIEFKLPGTFLCSMELRASGSVADLYADVRAWPQDGTETGFLEESDHGLYHPFSSVNSDGAPCAQVSKVFTVHGPAPGQGCAMHVINRSASTRTILSADTRMHIWPLLGGELPY